MLQNAHPIRIRPVQWKQAISQDNKVSIWDRVGYSTYCNVLIRVVHHGDEHIEEHHQGDDVISAKHRGSYKLGELVVGLNVGHVQTDQTEYGPEQRLQCFEQPISREINYDQPSLEHFILRNTNWRCIRLYSLPPTLAQTRIRDIRKRLIILSGWEKYSKIETSIKVWITDQSPTRLKSGSI